MKIRLKRLRESELERLNNEHKIEQKQRDALVIRLKEAVRQHECELDECRAKIKVLEEELVIEHENKIKCERMIDLHKNEIRELQIKLDECVNETKRLVS